MFIRSYVYPLCLCVLATVCGAQNISLPKSSPSDVTRYTLPNGLRVVIVRNDLAPVVTVHENYIVGGDETPAGFPGMAHAQEHMAFRGCADLSADQTAAIFAQLGGDNDADTQQNITQFFETVPAQDLEVALHADANCMRDIADSQAQWQQERGAIEQEVSRDLSNPTYKFLVRMNHDMFAGTPYEHDALGTRPSFDATTGAMLKSFQQKWYAPRLTPTVTVTGEIRHQPVLEVPPGQEGVASVLDGLFSYGTTTLDRLAFQKALDDIAANESAGTTFQLQVLKQFLSRGVQLLADNELNPALPEEAFKVVQQQTADSVAGLLQSPDYRANRALLEGLLPAGDPELRQATPEKISALTLQDVQTYYRKTFRPDLTTIVVIGDISPEDAKQEIIRWFGNWTATGPKPEVDLPPVPRNKATASAVPDPTRLQDQVTLAEELPINRFDPDYYPLQLANHILGGGFYATRLYRDLREKTGYVYNVDESLDAGRTRTSFSVSYGADPVNVPKARALIEQDLTAMQTAAPSPGEMQQARAMLLRQLPLGEASESQIADGLLARALVRLPLDEPVRAAEKYQALSAEEVRTAFAKWVRPTDLVEVIQGPPAK